MTRYMCGKKFSIQGSALLELMLVLPLVFLFGFAGIEFSRMFRTYEAMSTISREAARLSFLKCESAANFDSCMTTSDGVFSKIKSFADAALPGSEVMITAYDLDAGSLIVRHGIVGIDENITPSTFQTPILRQSSYFSEAHLKKILSVTSTPSLLYDLRVSGGPKKTRMIIGEVFYPLQSVAPTIFRFMPNSAVLHETTIY